MKPTSSGGSAPTPQQQAQHQHQHQHQQMTQQQMMAHLQALQATQKAMQHGVQPAVRGGVYQYNPSSYAARARPDSGVITEAEWDAVVGDYEDTGGCFRYVLGALVFVAVLILALSKFDAEYNIEVPQVETGKGFGEILNPERAADTADAPSSAEELESYYRTLGVEGRLNLTQKDAAAGGDDLNVSDQVNATVKRATSEDPDKERRRENFRVRKQIKKAFEKHQEAQGQLVFCGKSCEAENKQVELAYNKLASQVDRELFGVLLDAKDTKSARSTTPQQLKRKYEEKKARIMETEEDEEDRTMALEELKDAYDIIENPDARKYYLLYGAKPPEQMRHTSARHGGWGQEMALGTYKFRIIITWLDYLHRYLGLWGETCVLLGCVMIVGARLPAALSDAYRILDEMDPPTEEEIAAEEAAAAQTAKKEQ